MTIYGQIKENIIIQRNHGGAVTKLGNPDKVFDFDLKPGVALKKPLKHEIPTTMRQNFDKRIKNVVGTIVNAF